VKPLQFTIPVVPDKTVIVKEDILPRFYPHLHRHNEAQLVWILKGSGSLLVETKIHSFEANDIFLIAPNQAHLFNSVESDEGIHSLSIFYNPDGPLSYLFKLPELQKLYAFNKGSRFGFKVSEPHVSEVKEAMKKVSSSSEVELFLHFIKLLQSLSKSELRPLSESVNQTLSEGEGLRMGKVYDFVLKNFRKDIPLEQVSDIANLTPQAFCRYFKKHTGVTFVTFLNELRISEAQKKLIDGSFESITEVAYNSGFNSITNFNRVFKRMLGTAPKEYLYNYQKNLG
jgi:AraC-like DNA-binding protein